MTAPNPAINPAISAEELRTLASMATQMQEQGNRLFWGAPNKSQRQDMARLMRSGGFRMAELVSALRTHGASSEEGRDD